MGKFRDFLRKLSCLSFKKKKKNDKKRHEKLNKKNNTFNIKLDNYECSVDMDEVRPHLQGLIRSKTIQTDDGLVFDLAKDCATKPLHDPNMDRMREVWRDINPKEKLPLLSSCQYSIVTSEGKPVVIGNGSGKKLILAKENETQELVVIKISDDKDDALELVREFGMQNKAFDVLDGNIGSPVFRGFLQVVRSSSFSGKGNVRYFPVCEFCPAVSQLPFSLTVEQALDEHKQGRSLLTKDEWISMIQELLDAAKTYKENNICHLDINLNNVLLVFIEDRVFPVIIHYEFARNLNYKTRNGEPVFPPSNVFRLHPHTAPELIELDHPLETSDLYSIAYIIRAINNQVLHCERLEWELRPYFDSEPQERYTNLSFKIMFHLENEFLY